MAKEDALRFLVVTEKDENMRSAFHTIMDKYEGKNLSRDERDNVIQKEVIPFAKKYGYDFTPEDLAELQTTTGAKMSDEELDQVVGGRGQFTESNKMLYGCLGTVVTTHACEFAPDDQTFKTRYNQYPTDCPDYVWIGIGVSRPLCACCAHYQSNLSVT